MMTLKSKVASLTDAVLAACAAEIVAWQDGKQLDGNGALWTLANEMIAELGYTDDHVLRSAEAGVLREIAIRFVRQARA